MRRTYKEAIQLLQSRSQRAKPTWNVPNNYGMAQWLAQLGHTNLDSLNVIHITGTKGKGSTAAFTDSILREHFLNQSRPAKVGLYTSPHIFTERDRIRINYEPVSEECFTNAFFNVWDVLKCDEEGYKPGYLQLLMLMSVLIFKQEGVNVSIYEVHAGGRKDATNIFGRPIACGFSRIGMDHADLLGNSIEAIAWHKSGLMKEGASAFSVMQDHSPRNILQSESEKLGSPLKFVDIYENLPCHANVRQFAQQQNASLAIELAKAYLLSKQDHLSTSDIEWGIKRCRWPGRFQHIRTKHIDWFLDSAHNELSLPVAVSWFQSESSSALEPGQRCRRLLIYGHSSKRDTSELLDVLFKSCRDCKVEFDDFILSGYKRYGTPIPDHILEEQLISWTSRQPQAVPRLVSSARIATMAARNLQEQHQDVRYQVLITGSVHLVGQSLVALGVE